MSATDAYRSQLQAITAFLESQLSELPTELLYTRPGPSLNPVGWNYWHLLRIWDYDLNWTIRGQQPHADAWHRGGFTERSNYNPDGKGSDPRQYGLGSRYSDVDVDEVQIDLSVLQEYHQQLLSETDAYFAQVDTAELRRVVRTAVHPELATTCANRIEHTIGSCWMHIGEISYIKGMLGYPDSSYRATRERHS